MMHFPLTPKQETVDAIFSIEAYRKTAAILQSKTGVPASAELMYRNAVNEYKARFKQVHLYARSYKIPEYYRDFWLGIDGTNDNSILITTGLRVIAEYYVEQLEKAVLDVARHRYEFEERKRLLKKETNQKVKAELAKLVEMGEENPLNKFKRYIDTISVFHDPTYLREAVFRVGVAHKYIQGGSIDAANAESASKLDYDYLKGHKGTSYFGKKQVWTRMSEICGEEVTEKNYKKLWKDYGFFYARILDGEITDIAEI